MSRFFVTYEWAHTENKDLEPFASSFPGGGGGGWLQLSCPLGTLLGCGKTAGKEDRPVPCSLEAGIQPGKTDSKWIRNRCSWRFSSLRKTRTETSGRQGRGEAALSSVGQQARRRSWESSVCVRRWGAAATHCAKTEPSRQGDTVPRKPLKNEWVSEDRVMGKRVRETGRGLRVSHSTFLKKLSALLKRHPQKIPQKVKQWNDAAKTTVIFIQGLVGGFIFFMRLDFKL